MVETKDVVIAIFGATAAASALVLVFLGIIVQTLWTGNLSNPQKGQFKTAANVTLLAFLMGIACTGLGVWWLTLGAPGKIYLALIAAFLAQILLIGIAGLQVMYQAVWKKP
jgi:hypothetical protein